MAAFTTIDNPGAYFNVVKWSGDGTSPRTISGVGFAPGLTILKARDSAQYLYTYDEVRGAGVSKEIHTDMNEQEGAAGGTTGYLSSFNSDGFVVTAGTSNDNVTNDGALTYCSWSWKAGGSGSANTAGTINTTKTSVESTAKFSINTYDGSGSNATIGHGLSAVPAFLFVKKTNGNVDWGIYHHKCASDPETDYGILNTTAAWADNAGQWNDTAHTSTLISLGTNGECNASGGEYIIYAWAEVQGFSKFGAYEGNGNADGTFVYLGFRPAYFLVMNADSSGSDKYFFDKKRAGYNKDNNRLNINTAAAEGTDDRLDFLSNGVKIRNSGNPNNTDTWVYAAFAEAPLVNSSGVPNNAR